MTNLHVMNELVLESRLRVLDNPFLRKGLDLVNELVTESKLRAWDNPVLIMEQFFE